VIANIDAVEFLRSFPTESVDLIITDPAYESLEKHRAIGTTTRLKKSKSSSNDWFKIFPNSRFRELFDQFSRILRRDRHLYMFCDEETMDWVKGLCVRDKDNNLWYHDGLSSMRYWKALVWDKKKIGMGYHYRNRKEFILFFEKGKRKLNDLGIGDVLECDRVSNGYPTEKPVEIMEILIRQSTKPDEVVVDPFMGSGSVGVAAARLGRDFAGTDICKEAVEVTKRRIAEVRREATG
jgi:site-specific DNA-methyltransferase (adenine-specific)